MANKTLNVRIQNKYDTEANWASKNPVLLKGEAAYSSDKNGLYKIGDGTSKWSDLKYNSANTLVNHTSGEGFEFGYANSKTITIPKTTAVTTYYIQIAQKANFRFKNYYVKTSGNNTQYSFQAEISANAYMEPHVTLNTQKYNDSEVKSILICKNSTNSYHHDIYLVVNSSTSVVKTIYIWSDNTILDTVSTTAPTTATELNVNITNDSYIYTSKKIQANITGSAGSVAWGNITGKPSTYYTHPSYTARSSGLYKVTVDATGHVSGATAVSKADITALGIPGTDTNTWRGVQNNLTSTATDQSLSAAQGKILNETKTTRHDWNTIIKCATWSRLCYVPYSKTVVGSSFLLNIRGTRDNVVYNDTFMIKAHHPSKGNIVKISGCNYSIVSIRIVCDSSGNCYVEFFDSANGATNATTQTVYCTLIEVAVGSITKYTSFTNGTTLPANFTVAATLTTNTNSLQGNLTWNEITGKPTTFTPSSHTHDDRYYTESEINSKLAGYLPISGGAMTGNIKFNTKWNNYIGEGNTDNASEVGGDLNNLVIASWWGVSFTTPCAYQKYTNKTAVGIDCRNGIVKAAEFRGTFTGNASTASKWATARTLTLTGSVTGSVSIDGSGNVSLATTTNHIHSQYYDSGMSRAANTVLAAPNGANGTATFRKLVAADIPTLTKSKISDFPTSLAPTAGSNNYVRVYNSKDIGNSSTVTFNDLAKQHFAMGMINGATDNPYGAAKWAHGISMAWSNGANTSWISQIALGVQEGTGMWYRTSAGSGTIVGRTWNRVLDSSNYSSYAATKGHTHDLSTMINTLTTGTSAPTDSDYYVTQYAGGGTTTTSYHRRPHSALWTYIKSKADAVYQPKGSYAAANHTHNYAGSSSAGGAATSANKLNTNAGSATQPVYFSGGVPVACTYTLGKSVPADAKFTDTNTWRPLGTTGDTACAGNDSRLSNARPASDVYAWAKAASKPSYSWGEITGKPGAFNPSSHNHRDLDAIGSVGYYGSDVANSNGWYKVYSTTLTGYNDHVARLSIVSGYNPYASGLLILHLRCNNTTSLNVQQLIWETRQGFNADDVIINTNGNTWTLYLKITNTQYGRVKIRVLESTSTVNNWSISLSNNNTKESTNPKATATAKDGAIVNYANSAGSVAWSGISGKPSLVGKTIKSLTAVSSSGWSDLTSAQNLIPDMSVIAYWNGAYSNTSSNLAYCNKGAFGTIVTKNAGDYATAGHTHHYAGSSSAGGSATSAIKLDTSTAGSATQPVYFTGGKPVACTYTLGKSVPSNAVFTDTNNKMTQTAIASKDYTNWRTILWGASNSGTEGFTPTTVTDGAFTDTNLSYQPSTGTLRAKVFKGALSANTAIGSASGLETTLEFTAGELKGTSAITQTYYLMNDFKTDYVFGVKNKSKAWISYYFGDQVYFKNSSADISALAGKMLPPVLTDFSGNKNNPGAGTGRVLSIASNVDAKIIKFRIFTSSSATTATTVNVTYSTSDIRLKDNVKDTDIKDALSVINKMKIRQFDWKDDNKHQKIGFVADELEELDDKLVVGGGWEDEEHTQMNVKGVDTFYMMGYVVKGMQELSEQIKALTEENKELKKQIEGLKREG